MKQLFLMLFTSAFLFSCSKDKETQPLEKTLAVQLSERLVTAINNRQIPDAEVTAYFAKGNPLIVDENTTLHLNEKQVILEANKSFKMNDTEAPGATMNNAGASQAKTAGCEYSPLIIETWDAIHYLIIPNNPGCPQGPRFSIRKLVPDYSMLVGP